MTTHTGEVLYTCTFCPKTFNSSANMFAHRKKAHRIEWEKSRKIQGLSENNISTTSINCKIPENSDSLNVTVQNNQLQVQLDYQNF